jgi:type I restriction enzyme S subunit
MKKAFPKLKLGEICTLANGYPFKPSDWNGSGMPIVRIQNLNDPTKPFNRTNTTVPAKCSIDDGDVLLSWSGTPGTSFGCFMWTRGPALLNQHIFRVTVDSDLMDKQFFIYAVNSQLDEMIGKAHGGVGLRHITKGKLESIELGAPSLAEQRRIVGRINEMLARVNEIDILRSEANPELEALPAALVAAIGELEMAPTFTVEALIDDSQNGRSIASTPAAANGHVLSLSSVRTVNLDFTCIKPVQLDGRTAATYSIRCGDVFVSRSNTRQLVGLSAIANADGPARTIYPDLLIKLSVKRDKVMPEYLAFALRLPVARDQIRRKAKGTSQSMVKISGAELRQVTIPVPNLVIQGDVVDEFKRRYTIAQQVSEGFKSLEVSHLRDAILRKAFAGEL